MHVRPANIIQLLTAGVIAKVTFSVVSTYGGYLPPDFQEADFLLGRAGYFFGSYSVAFYGHIFAGPFTLLAGLLLLSERFRMRSPVSHRVLGRVQFGCVMLVSLSGLWMAGYAATGTVAGLGFGSLAIVTAVTAWLGVQSAMSRHFARHRRWMIRNYILLCSAVVLRLTAGVTIVTNSTADWIYPLSAWTSWLVPLAICEVVLARSKQGSRLATTSPRAT